MPTIFHINNNGHPILFSGKTLQRVASSRNQHLKSKPSIPSTPATTVADTYSFPGQKLLKFTTRQNTH